MAPLQGNSSAVNKTTVEEMVFSRLQNRGIGKLVEEAHVTDCMEACSRMRDRPLQGFNAALWKYGKREQPGYPGLQNKEICSQVMMTLE